MHDQQERRRTYEPDWREIADRVVGQLGIDRHVGAVGARRADEQRIAVGRRLRRARGTDGAAGAAVILDEHGLPELGADVLRHHSRRDVGAAADRERHDHLYGLRRILLGMRCSYEEEREKELHFASTACMR